MNTEGAGIQPGSRVRLHLEIRLADGTQALSSFGEEAMELTLGDGTLVPGLEGLLIGLQEGADERILADGTEFYGPRDETKIHWLPRGDFPPQLDLIRGQVVAFDTPAGQEIAGILLKTDADRVQVDLNHPLAGRSLQIRVKIVSIADPEVPTPEFPGN